MITLRAAARHDRADAPAVAPSRTERARPDLRVVEDGPTKTRTDRDAEPRSAGGVVATLLVILLFVCVFGVVVFQVFLVQTQSHLDQLGRDIVTQEDRAKDLRLQTTDLEAPDRIVKDAEGRLGMIVPGDVVWLQPNQGDDAKAAFDPAKEAAPVSAPPTTAAGTGSPASGTQVGGTQVGGSQGASQPGTGTKGATTPTTAWTPPTTAWTPSTAARTTPTTTAAKTAPTTTPTTAPKTTTTVKPTTTVARPTTTTRTR